MCKEAMDLVVEKDESFEEAAVEVIKDMINTFQHMITKMPQSKETLFKQLLKKDLKEYFLDDKETQTKEEKA